MEIEVVAACLAVPISLVAIVLSIRQQRGPDIKFLCRHPVQFKILKCDRKAHDPAYGDIAEAQMVIDLVVANDGASAGSLMSCDASFLEAPQSVLGKEWSLEFTRLQMFHDGLAQDAALPGLCPLAVGAGENFPSKLTIRHQIRQGIYEQRTYEETLSRSDVWIRVSYAATKKRFFIGPTTFDEHLLDIRLRRQAISAELDRYFAALDKRKR